MIAQKDAFLCGAKGVSVGIAFQRRIGTALFGGEGFIMQSLEGDGLAFLHAGGTIERKKLAAGETLRVDTGCNRGARSLGGLRHRVGGRGEIRPLRRRGFLLRPPGRPRVGLAPVASVQPAGRADSPGRPPDRKRRQGRGLPPREAVRGGLGRQLSGSPECIPGQVSEAGERFLGSFSWEGWKPTERATLLFVVQSGKILLIRKHRGLGKGKLNGPGGRVEPGETPAEAAVREVEEELGIEVREPRYLGELLFQFVSGYALRVFVYRAERYRGEPRVTEEATPVWVPLTAIPYEEMWEDDRDWLPLLIQGRPFRGRYVFENEAMVAGETRPGLPG